MKFAALIWAGIRRNRGRSNLILLQVVIAFTLFGVLQGLNGAINKAVAATHADRLYVGSRQRFGTPLPIAIMSTVQSTPGVIASAARFQFGAVWQKPDQQVPIMASDIDDFLMVYPELQVAPAARRAMKQLQDGVIVGEATMTKYHWKIGQRIVVQSIVKKDGSPNWTFDIVGTYLNGDDPDSSQLLMANYHYVNESLNPPQANTMAVAALRVADPSRAATVETAIDKHFLNSPNETLTQSELELAQSQVASIGDIDTVVHRVIAATFFVLLFATGALMMQSIRERTPELAVLKTFGFSDRLVMMLILAETLALCVCGAAVGLGLASRILPLARNLIGLGTIPLEVVVTGFVFAIVLALAAGAIPAWRGLRLHVVDALANR
ncbi:MAG TPA: FtsX-like permease family protein [Steroidobacteraceae bacterium]|nr:FtsX-like permease family protein [Steroidobacteraceae bacterium]